jgi:hypothetical protein
MKNLVRISKSKAKELPLSASCLYKWRHMGKYPELFVKIGGAVFVDLDAFDRVIEAGRQRAVHRKPSAEAVRKDRQWEKPFRSSELEP